ncbi:MAG TPA: hypothetical protein VGL13_08925, partial [Polyangiaceae bacterium]
MVALRWVRWLAIGAIGSGCSIPDPPLLLTDASDDASVTRERDVNVVPPPDSMYTAEEASVVDRSDARGERDVVDASSEALAQSSQADSFIDERLDGPGDAGADVASDQAETNTADGSAACTADGAGALRLTSGEYHSCALDVGGVRCWGFNQDGELGDGSSNNSRPLPTSPAIPGVTVRAVVSGGYHVCVLSTLGGVRCWGLNTFGQLGVGSSTDIPLLATPPATDVFTNAKAISAGAHHTCVLTNAGGVRCWGNNSSGQLGDGTTTDRSTPPANDIAIGVPVLAVVASAYNTCVLTTAGGVRCWGDAEFGLLGDGTFSDRSSPPTSDIALGARVVALGVGSAHICALTDAHGVRCWGANDRGELGDGTNTDRATPPATDVLVGEPVQAVSVGDYHTCVLTMTGNVWCWGDNSNFQ